MANQGRFLMLNFLRNRGCTSQLQTINRNYSNGPDNWWSKLLHVRRVEPAHKAHAQILTNKNVVFELQVHNIKPDRMGDYIKLSDHHLRLVHERENYPCKLFGSWSTAFGHQDQAVHIWLYEDGYDSVKSMSEHLWEDKDYLEYRQERGQMMVDKTMDRSEYLEYKKERGKMLIDRTNSLLLPFAFWGEAPKREPGNLYELRSYHLRPGTLIEWANNWAKGIEARRGEDENVAGFFTQIGDLYLVHHLWAYKDLESRKRIREEAWRKPGWDECVAYTVPLIRKMDSRIMIPLPCSPMK